MFVLCVTVIILLKFRQKSVLSSSTCNKKSYLENKNMQQKKKNEHDNQDTKFPNQTLPNNSLGNSANSHIR